MQHACFSFVYRQKNPEGIIPKREEKKKKERKLVIATSNYKIVIIFCNLMVSKSSQPVYKICSCWKIHFFSLKLEDPIFCFYFIPKVILDLLYFILLLTGNLHFIYIYIYSQHQLLYKK